MNPNDTALPSSDSLVPYDPSAPNDRAQGESSLPSPFPAVAPPLNAGIRAFLEADQLFKAGGDPMAALLLARSAVRQLIVATLLERGQVTQDTQQAELWKLARLLPLGSEGTTPHGWFTGPQDWFESFVVSDAGDLALAEVPEVDQPRLLRDLLEFALRLAGPLDQAKNGAARRARRRRRLAIAAVACLALALGYGVRRALLPTNLAFGRPVVLNETLPPHAVNPAGLVDGDQLNVGFHSTPRQNPSVTIDLGAVRSISRIEVFNRPDCCQDRAVPLRVETSIDGQNYVQIKREQHTFYHLTIRLPSPKPARYVRLVRGGGDVFHLSEVEVY